MQVCVDENGSQTWTLYDAGPKTVRCPLVCLPPVSGRADTFFKQVLPLSARGYRVISVFIINLPLVANCISLNALVEETSHFGYLGIFVMFHSNSYKLLVFFT